MRHLTNFLSPAFAVPFFVVFGSAGERVYDGAAFAEVFPTLMVAAFFGSLSLTFTLQALSYDFQELKDKIDDLKPAKEKRGQEAIAG